MGTAPPWRWWRPLAAWSPRQGAGWLHLRAGPAHGNFTRQCTCTWAGGAVSVSTWRLLNLLRQSRLVLHAQLSAIVHVCHCFLEIYHAGLELLRGQKSAPVPTHQCRERIACRAIYSGSSNWLKHRLLECTYLRAAVCRTCMTAAHAPRVGDAARHVQSYIHESYRSTACASIRRITKNIKPRRPATTA